MKRVVASALIADGVGRILLSRKVDSGLYCPPGGKVEAGESIELGLHREVAEEVGAHVSPRDMLLLGWLDLPDKVVFFYLIRRWIGKIRNREPEKHRDWEWLPDLPPDGECVEGIRAFRASPIYGEMRDRIGAAEGRRQRLPD